MEEQPLSKKNIKRELLIELNSISFPNCATRNNIMAGSIINAFALGDVNYRGQKNLGKKTRGPSKWNAKYPRLFELVKTFIYLYRPTFSYTTIQINKNVQCKPHIDKNNVGESFIIGIGDYSHGELVIEGKKINIKNRLKKFDGHQAHWVMPFDGDRYTIVFFTHTFKPPNRSLTNLIVSEHNIVKRNGEIIREY